MPCRLLAGSLGPLPQHPLSRASAGRRLAISETLSAMRRWHKPLLMASDGLPRPHPLCGFSRRCEERYSHEPRRCGDGLLRADAAVKAFDSGRLIFSGPQRDALSSRIKPRGLSRRCRSSRYPAEARFPAWAFAWHLHFRDHARDAVACPADMHRMTDSFPAALVERAFETQCEEDCFTPPVRGEGALDEGLPPRRFLEAE